MVGREKLKFITKTVCITNNVILWIRESVSDLILMILGQSDLILVATVNDNQLLLKIISIMQELL